MTHIVLWDVATSSDGFARTNSAYPRQKKKAPTGREGLKEMIFLLYEEAVANRSARASGGTVTRRSGDAEEINGVLLIRAVPLLLAAFDYLTAATALQMYPACAASSRS